MKVAGDEQCERTELAAHVMLVGLTQLMLVCVGADDSLPENILYKGVKTAPAGGLAAAPTSNCVTLGRFSADTKSRDADRTG